MPLFDCVSLKDSGRHMLSETVIPDEVNWVKPW